MAKFLLTVWPYTGHIYPNLALAQALRADGHEVAFYSGALARPTIEGEGFVCFSFIHLARAIGRIVGQSEANPSDGWDHPALYHRLSEHYTATFDERAIRRAGQFKRMFQEWFLGTVPEQVADVRAIAHQWNPDVIVSDPFLWGPMLVLHEADAIPVAIFSFFAGCMLPGSDAPPFGLGLASPRRAWPRIVNRLVSAARNWLMADLRRSTDQLRSQYGLAPLSGAVMEHGGRMPLYLVASVADFDYERRDLPPSVEYVGPCLWDKSPHQPAPAWLEQYEKSASPLIYVTEGTAHTRAPLLLRAAAAGLGDLPLQVVMTTGFQRDPAALLPTTSPNIRVERWVPHSDLFQKTSLVVTHGGSGTVLAALDAGLPMVVVPMQWDHLENAQRVVEVGAGIRVAPEHLTPERLRAAVQEVLTSPHYRENAQRMSGSLQRAGGPARAAQLLGAMAVRRQEPMSAQAHLLSSTGAATERFGRTERI